jgi:3-methyladenine DNA glycosylase/8-oxoguanine DNA glycosylase
LKKKVHFTPYTYLLRSIISQQISTKAAASILKKFEGLFPESKVNFAILAALTDEQLKSVGISPQKMGYMRDLTNKIVNGALVDHSQLKRMSDEEIIEHLTQIKGIGVWTVQMLLIFYMHRKDVMPTKDLGVQKGFKITYNKRKLPKEEEILKASKKWQPYRSVASLYLWAKIDED